MRLLPLLLAASLHAQTLPVRLDETLNKLYGPEAWSLKSFSGVRWLDKGASYTALENGGKEIARYNTETGRRDVLLAKQELTISSYQLSADASRLLLFTNTKKVWRENTRGDYWVIQLSSGSKRKLGAGAPESSLMFARFSPDGTRVAYVRENNLYVEDAATGAITQLTHDGSETIVNGTSDWVYEEEFALRDGFRWSPDGKSIAYFRFDTSAVGRFPLVNETDSLYPTIQWFRYPKSGTPNSSVRAGVVAATGGETKWMSISAGANDSYLPRMEWAANATELVLQHVNRKQTVNQVYLASAATGEARLIHKEEDAAWLDIVDEIHWLGGGKEFLWMSESDGWTRVYALSRDGRQRRALTPARVDVAAIVGTGGDEQWLYYIASPGDATQRHLFRVPLHGAAKVERLTKGRGWHSYQLSPDARYAVETVSTFDSPAESRLIRLPARSTVRVLADNTAYRDQIAPLMTPPAEFVQVKIVGNVTLDGWMIKPPDFHPSRKYPLLVHVYSEPFDLTATDRFTTRSLFHRALAREGYIIVSMDNRGTPSLKGRAWRKAIHGAIGPLSSREQAEAARALLASRSYLDPNRVAIWGWSGGGTATLNILFRYPDLFKLGMSVAPVPDQRLYDTVYQERYMGTPEANRDGYQSSSPIHFAAGLQGRLLLIHGTGDDNVHWQGTQLLVNKLVELGKQFDMVVYPNRSHAISEGKGTTLHLHRTLARYLLEHMR
ncbi:MAG: S9 family peptidase [Acidobacteria bacterium]|nr:S9 family peptidase [Acidobacteriota bacterium]